MAISLARTAGESAIAGCGQGFARHLDIIEAGAAGASDLNFLVSFARDQNNIAGLRRGDGQRDGFAAVGLDGVSRAAALQSWQSIFDDGHGIFAARIVGSQHHEVASAAGRLAHQWPLALIAIAAAPEERAPPAERRVRRNEIARQGCEISQRIISVSIVHDYGEGLAGFDSLETPGGGLGSSQGGW